MTDPKPNSQPHPATIPIDALVAGCQTQRTRRGGPGGQHRNKTETAIVVTHSASGVSGQASERRSQQANREAAIFRLRLNLAIAIRTTVDVQSAEALPSELWRQRISGGKILPSNSS